MPRSSSERTIETELGASSTLEVGAGRFDPRQAGRLQAGVVITQLEPIQA